MGFQESTPDDNQRRIVQLSTAFSQHPTGQSREQIRSAFPVIRLSVTLAAAADLRFPPPTATNAAQDAAESTLSLSEVF